MGRQGKLKVGTTVSCERRISNNQPARPTISSASAANHSGRRNQRPRLSDKMAPNTNTSDGPTGETIRLINAISPKILAQVSWVDKHGSRWQVAGGK